MKIRGKTNENLASGGEDALQQTYKIGSVNSIRLASMEILCLNQILQSSNDKKPDAASNVKLIKI